MKKAVLRKYIKLILHIFAVIILMITNSNILADSMSSAFDKRDNYKNKTTLGDPASMRKITDYQEDVSGLKNLNDSSLMDQGADSLRNSAQGKILQNAEEKKIEAIERYKINPNNPWLKDSLKIEEDPLSKTGGRQLGSTEEITKTIVKKSCIEGVDFNVDVGLELVLEAEEEEYFGLKQKKLIDMIYGVIPNSWWIEGHMSDASYHGRNGYGYSGTSKIINSLYRDEIAKHISLKVAINSEAKIEIPDQEILFVPCVNRSKNVNFSNCPEFFGLYESYENAIITFTYNVQEKQKRLIEKAEYWQVVTEGTERLAEANECYETGRVCLKSGVKTFFGKYDISRPCWYEKISYRCRSEPKNGCDHLIKQDCRLQDSECEYRIGSICLRWKRDYLCGGKRKELKFSLADSPIYCLGGDCHTPTIEENQDFANVAYLAAVNEASKDCVKESNGVCKNPITVFPGQAESCKKIIVGLIDCCSSMKGWGKNANLCRCSGGEKGLALKRDKGLCHTVGTYCSKKDPALNKCLVKKTSHCCFSSKLARIFHEQGRQQLGIGWGSEKSPNCRPLTLDELKNLDFSKFDMEELFDALLSKGKSNMNKSFPNLAPGEIPDIQKEHMKTTTNEKRDIRRKEEEEVRKKRIEKERLERDKQNKLAEQISKKRNLQSSLISKEKDLVSLESSKSNRSQQWNKLFENGGKPSASEYDSLNSYLNQYREEKKRLDLDIVNIKNQLEKL